jgi:hypothetical protein
MPGRWAALDRLPAARELGIDALQVSAHRVPRLAQIVGGERLVDRAMIVHRRHLQRRRLEVLLHEPPHRAAPAIPEILDDRLEDGVSGRCSDPYVEVAVELGKILVLLLQPLHLGERGANAGQVGDGRLARRHRRDLALDQPARAEQLERSLAFALALVLGGRGRAAPRRCHHPDPGADADIDETFELERDQRLAQRRPRHAELRGELALRRQPLPHGELA